MAFHLCCFYSSAVLIVGVPFPFGVTGRMWNSIVSVPDHSLCFFFLIETHISFQDCFVSSNQVVDGQVLYSSGCIDQQVKEI